MSGPRQPGRSGRLRLLAGFSVVLGAVAVLLRADGKGKGRSGGMNDDHPGAGPDGLDRPATGSSAQPNEHGSPPSPEALKDGFEPRDANTRSIGTVMVVAVALIAASITGLFVLLGSFHRADRATPPLTAQQRAPIAPPGPPLQANPQYDLASLGKRETGLLNTYQWLSPEHTAARIPIDRAMAMVVGRPLDPPTAPAEATP